VSLNALEHFCRLGITLRTKMSGYNENQAKEMMHRDLVVNIMGKMILA
jgi:hypothetical protein